MNYYFENADETYGYTDLVIERNRADISENDIEYRKYDSDGGTWECVHVHSDSGAKSIGKPQGSYYTLSTGRMDLLSNSEKYDVQEELARRLCEMCEQDGIIPARILVVGLGNARLTPDTVGVKSAYTVHPTLHVSKHDNAIFEELECSEIAVCVPGVCADTGLDSSDVVKSIARRVSPDLIICIDSIATNSPVRLGSTIQLSNTGIIPGGGVGNKINAINYDTTGVPVFAIGVPTVINSQVLCNTGTNQASKFGNWSMLVAPREIDEICECSAVIIGGAINQAFGIDDI